MPFYWHLNLEKSFKTLNRASCNISLKMENPRDFRHTKINIFSLTFVFLCYYLGLLRLESWDSSGYCTLNDEKLLTTFLSIKLFRHWEYLALQGTFKGQNLLLGLIFGPKNIIVQRWLDSSRVQTSFFFMRNSLRLKRL